MSDDPALNGHSTPPTYVRDMAQMGLDDDHQVWHRQDAMDRLNSGLDNPPQSANPFRDKYAIKEKAPVDEPRRDKDRSNRSSSNSDTGRRSWVDKMRNTLSRDNKHAAPGIDAPVSAVNSGERKVRVQYKNASITLTITPTTHADDILFAASTYWPDIDAYNFMLMESFATGQISLERPLRRYEYIREVMNSWAYDSENKLFILPPASAEALERLEKGTVSATRPADVTFHVYHSQKPKKWEKRHVTLRGDGQVTVSKKTFGKGATSICHISDFDIYSPNSQTVAVAKSPKRWCYAVKSQQKSSLFVSTEKFVHFFATDDRGVADGWYQAVQSWRSWYMVNMLGLGDPQVDIDRRNEALGIKSYHSNRNSTEKYSSDSESYSHHLIDQATSSQELFARKMGMREHCPPPAAFPRKLTVDTGVDSVPGPLLAKDESPFSPTGLLGQTYTMRQRDMREREEREKQEIFSPQGLVHRQANSPTGPSQSSSRSNTMNSSHVPDLAGSTKRSHSTRQPKPLVDLTPVFQEQPQHRNKGRGVTVTPGVPLVEAVTGPDLAPSGIAIPPATTWRRPQHSDEMFASHARSRYRSNTARSAAQHHRIAPNTYRTAPSSPTGEYSSPENPFAPNSLLSRAPDTTQGARPIGHGVATGDRNASRPMLDLSEDNPFVQGSLLREL